MKDKKLIFSYILLILGLLPFLFILVCCIRDAFVGVPELSIFIPPAKWYYGFDALRYDMMWVWIILVAYWYITVPWIILLIVGPIVFLIWHHRSMRKEQNRDNRGGLKCPK